MIAVIGATGNTGSATVRNLFVVTGHNPQSGEQQINILEAAKAAGVQFFVKVSGGRDIVGPEVGSLVGRGAPATC